MAAQGTTDERIFSLLAHRPRHIIDGMITIAEPPKPSANWRTSASSLGDLEALPLELLHAIFAILDFKTLSDITKTCLRGRELVNSLPEFRDLRQNAPQALAALGKTRLIRHFTAATVHAALLSEACISCNSYGAFLYLPTCERCCHDCLIRNQSLWVIPISTAKKCFGISDAGLKTLPTMRSIPGKYYVKHMISRQRPIRLVCVGAVKKLAIAENRSEEFMLQDLEHHRSAYHLLDYYLWHFLQQAPMTPPGPELFIRPTGANVPTDMFCGMASLPFPVLRPGNDVESGVWCLGCELLYREWSSNKPCPDHLSHLVLPGCRVEHIVYKMQQVARSRSGMLSHIHSCSGAKELMKHSESIQHQEAT